jgi:orotate phosphoribosyltransferase
MNRIEGVFEPGERACLIEDVVTTAGALIETLHAVRDAGLDVGTAICVVDREQGGLEALAAESVELRPIFRAGELLETAKSASASLVDADLEGT